jgi:hypothetical protein
MSSARYSVGASALNQQTLGNHSWSALRALRAGCLHLREISQPQVIQYGCTHRTPSTKDNPGNLKDANRVRLSATHTHYHTGAMTVPCLGTNALLIPSSLLSITTKGCRDHRVGLSGLRSGLCRILPRVQQCSSAGTIVAALLQRDGTQACEAFSCCVQ